MIRAPLRRRHAIVLVPVALLATIASIAPLGLGDGVVGSRGLTAGVLGSLLQPGRPALVCDIPQGDLESSLGIRIESLSITADGGLIDLRFRVTDGARAMMTVHHADDAQLRIVRELDGLTSTRGWMGHQMHADLVTGRTYYELLVNETGGLRSGDAVTLEIGALRLEHVLLD